MPPIQIVILTTSLFCLFPSLLSIRLAPTETAMALQVLGITMSMIGLAGTIVICALPMWRVTAFIGTNIVVAQVFWQGLWMNCVYESTGQMQCKIYDALLDLSPDLQAARGLVVITIVLACLGFLIFLVGAQCTNCLDNPRVKARLVLASGVTFVLSGLTTLVPVSWTASSIIQDFYNPLVPEALKRELGAALYVGWVTAGFLLFGGAVLCTTCPPEKVSYPARYTLGKISTHSSSYAIKNYV
ncbi:claudin-4-like [Anguilla rostrata]